MRTTLPNQRHLAAVSWASLSMTLNKPWNREVHLDTSRGFLPKPFKRNHAKTIQDAQFDLTWVNVQYGSKNSINAAQRNAYNMSTVQRHWPQHVYSTKAFSWRQNISNINRFQQSSAQYWQALPNPKALATKREALFKLPFGVNINQSSSTFKGCSLTALWASKFFSIWILDHLDHRATRYCSGL